MASAEAASKILSFLLEICILISVLTCIVRGTCPNHPSCECTPNYINCTCTGAEDTLYISQLTDKFTGTEFIVSKCNSVEVEKLALRNLNLEMLKFVELGELNVQSYSLTESSINNILMHNISFLELQSYSLSDVKDCMSLEIINASVENFPPTAINGIEVKSIEIKDCHIGTVHSRAITLSNIERFTFENNYINTFDITSIIIRTAKQFSFIRNAVTASSFGALSLAEVDNIEVGHSSFRQVHGNMIMTMETKSFSFHDCYIETCENKAFWSINATNYLKFSDNEIKNAEEDSLIPNLGTANFSAIPSLQVKQNLLTCDCRLEWIFERTDEKYKLLKKGSICNEPEGLKGKSLLNLEMSVDNVDKCVDIREKLEDVTEIVTTLRSKNSTKKPKNTKKPKVTKSKFTTENTIPTKDAQKSFITDVSAEKQEAVSGSVKLYFCNSLISIAVLVMINRNFYYK
ncbi:leucine-rich repeat and immunoglobulin-like domain-containing nogo receptor-interacting protein 1-B [Centruroides vittatus]|uniref:leucine-rich repeat and immunoglobulin-like domain-containing nogo receptor-interacting protein 1-B n=1 Tax=Centruroides vittatus TaxID=120091 RepID=UPI00350FDA8A